MAKAESESIFIELGQSGLRRSGGYVREEFLRELQGPRGMRVYREMRDNSAIIGAALQAIEMLIRQVSWDVEPYVVPGAQEPTLEAEARAEFLESCTTDLSTTWTETVGEFLTMLPYLATIVVLVLISRNESFIKANMPASIGKPFFPGS
jgi:hypothetical protein